MKKLILAALLMTAAQSASAQQSTSALSYIISFPTASMGDFVGDQVSFRGIGFDWAAPMGGGPLALGFTIRWLYFRNLDEDGTFTQEGVTVNGRLFRAVDSFPIEFLARYQFAQEGQFRPYIGTGIGTIYGLKELDIGALGQQQVGWQFAISPEAGMVFYPGAATTGFSLNFRYDAGFGSDAIDPITNLSIALGISSGF